MVRRCSRFVFVLVAILAICAIYVRHRFGDQPHGCIGYVSATPAYVRMHFTSCHGASVGLWAAETWMTMLQGCRRLVEALLLEVGKPLVVRRQEAALRRLEAKHGSGYGKPPPGSESEARAKRYNENCMR